MCRFLLWTAVVMPDWWYCSSIRGGSDGRKNRQRPTELRQLRTYLALVAIRSAFLPALSPVAPLGCLRRQVSGAVWAERHLQAWRAVAGSPPGDDWHLSGA